MHRLILPLLLSTFVLSCTSTRKALDPWLGATKHELILNWGPPIRTTSDGGSGEVLVYAAQGEFASTPGNRPRTFWNYTYMYVDTTGKIYHWLRKTSQVPPTEVGVIIRR